MARIRRRRADAPPPASLPPDAAADVARPAPDPAGADQPTLVTSDVPAGADPAEAHDARPGFRERGRMRRRLRYLRRLRELGFRDIGGLLFDLDRFGRDRQDLVRAKLDALRAVDTELRALETALDDMRPLHELREAGVAACPRCGGLHGTEASFCPTCGLHLDGPRTVGDVAGPALPAPVAPEPSELPAATTNGSGPAHDEPAEAPAAEDTGDPAR